MQMHSFLCVDSEDRDIASYPSANKYRISFTQSLQWKSKLRNVWGQQKHVSTLWSCFRCIATWAAGVPADGWDARDSAVPSSTCSREWGMYSHTMNSLLPSMKSCIRHTHTQGFTGKDMKHQPTLVPGVAWHLNVSNAHDMTDAHKYE